MSEVGEFAGELDSAWVGRALAASSGNGFGEMLSVGPRSKNQ